MLIHSIAATDFRKYKALNIRDLPQHGVITVSGLNESGKSSIGEAICFALFGRTFNLSDASITKLIRWEADSASVTLTLNDDKGDAYIINRSVDQQGNTNANLTRAEDNKQIAEGTENTNDEIHKLLGYTFDTFTDSFYLVARDLNNPDPNSSSIKQMAGIGEYSQITDELVAASQSNEERITELHPIIAEHQSQLDALNIDETWLPELVDAREVVALESEQKQELNGELAEFSSNYKEQQRQYRKTRNGWRFLNMLTWILIPIMLIAWLIWSAYNFFPEQVDKLSQRPDLTQHVETVREGVNTWGFQVTMGLVLLTSLLLFFKWRAESKTDMQLDHAEQLSNTLKASHEHSQHSFKSLITSRLRQTLQGKIQTQSALASPPQDDRQRLSKLTTQCKDFTADCTEIENTVQRLRDTLDQQQQELGLLRPPLDAKIDSEKLRSDEAGVIRSSLREREREVTANRKQISIQQTGVRLLQRASDALITDFNASITRRTEKTMPLFTDNRYKQIKISKDLSVHVYSDDKMDWIDFDEVSSGTQRQILLAVRIAMSEQLARNTDNEQQFIFLDEPFTYFDQERTKSSLASLPKINDTTCQVWIVAQEFPEDSHTDKHIHCPETGDQSLNA